MSIFFHIIACLIFIYICLTGLSKQQPVFRAGITVILLITAVYSFGFSLIASFRFDQGTAVMSQNPAQAEHFFKQALNMNECPEYERFTGYSLMLQKKYDEALIHYESIPEKHLNNIYELAYTYGQVGFFLQEHSLDKAVKYSQESLKYNYFDRDLYEISAHISKIDPDFYKKEHYFLFEARE